MATLTLRGTKGAPLTHVELDANFSALDSDIKQGNFDSGLEIQGGISVDQGDLNLVEGNLVLAAGDFHYNPKLGFVDLVAGLERARFDSTGALMIGSKVNSQSVGFKVARSGNQHILSGCISSNSGQYSKVELGPAGSGTETGSGIKATQTTSNFNDWNLVLFSSSSTNGQEDAITIGSTGEISVHNNISFEDSATFNEGIHIGGNVVIDGQLNIGGNQIGTGSVESVGLTAPTGFVVTNTPITSVGNLQLGFDSGYQLLNDSDQANWNLSYNQIINLDQIIDSALDSNITDKLSSGNVVGGDTQILAGNGLQGGGTLDSDVNLAMDSQYTGDFTVSGSITSGDITSSGNITASGTINAAGDVVAFYNASDERLKTDIREIENALDKVSSLRGVQFEYIASGIPSTGLIAQDLEPILPEAIFEDEDGYKGIRYQLTVGLLVEAIKELKAEIEELKKAK